MITHSAPHGDCPHGVSWGVGGCKKCQAGDRWTCTHHGQTFDAPGKCPACTPFTPDAGVKFDNGKPTWTLMPWRELEEVVHVLMFGAERYPSPDNWKRVSNARERYRNALVRHVVKYIQGERLDPDSGKSHLSHAICNCLFLAWFDNEGTP